MTRSLPLLLLAAVALVAVAARGALAGRKGAHHNAHAHAWVHKLPVETIPDEEILAKLEPKHAVHKPFYRLRLETIPKYLKKEFAHEHNGDSAPHTHDLDAGVADPLGTDTSSSVRSDDDDDDEGAHFRAHRDVPTLKTIQERLHAKLHLLKKRGGGGGDDDDDDDARHHHHAKTPAGGKQAVAKSHHGHLHDTDDDDDDDDDDGSWHSYGRKAPPLVFREVVPNHDVIRDIESGKIAHSLKEGDKRVRLQKIPESKYRVDYVNRHPQPGYRHNDDDDDDDDDSSSDDWHLEIIRRPAEEPLHRHRDYKAHVQALLEEQHRKHPYWRR